MVFSDRSVAAVPTDLLSRVYKHYFGAPLYDVLSLDEWVVVSLNSMLGETWDPRSEACHPEISSYGEVQLRWLDHILKSNKNKHVVIVVRMLILIAYLWPTLIESEHIHWNA